MKTFQVTYQPTRLYASEDVARWYGIRHADFLASFYRVCETWPEVADCGVQRTTTEPKHGGKPFASLMISGAALAVFLYWREHHGKPETVFSRLRLALDAGEL